MTIWNTTFESPIKFASIAPASSARSRSATYSGRSSAASSAKIGPRPTWRKWRLRPTGTCAGDVSFKVFLGSSEELIKNIHDLAPVAELDGDEIGYLVSKVAEIKRRG